jgi:hypothetical protein
MKLQEYRSDCKYKYKDVDRILDFKSWSAQRKIDTLLHIDCAMYCNLGISSTKTQVNETKQRSRVIYRAIKKIDPELGKMFLHHMD